MDAAATRGLWLLPTFGRAATKVPKFLAACMATHVSTPGALLVEVDDYAANQAAYDALELPEGWRVELFDEEGTGPVTQAACERLCEGLDWVGWLADDLLPATPRWDVAAIEFVEWMELRHHRRQSHGPQTDGRRVGVERRALARGRLAISARSHALLCRHGLGNHGRHDRMLGPPSRHSGQARARDDRRARQHDARHASILGR